MDQDDLSSNLRWPDGEFTCNNDFLISHRCKMAYIQI